MKGSAILPVVLAVLLCSSCTHKDLIFEIGNVITVRFDWSDCPSASPESMRLAVFGNDAQPVFFPANGHESVEVELGFGRYQFISYNSDTEVLHSRGYSWDTFEIFTKEAEEGAFARIFNTRSIVLPRARGTEDESFIEEPDPLWVSTADKVNVPGSNVTMRMKSAIVNYNFTISNVENLSNIRTMAATISGMSESYLPVEGRCSETYCTIPFIINQTGESTIAGSVRTFGYWRGGSYDMHKLVVYVETIDGTKVYYTFDVTAVLEKADESINGSGDVDVDVEIKNLPIPEPIYNGSGLHPLVDVWQEVEIEIDL